jgi:hypothetical protein
VTIGVETHCIEPEYITFCEEGTAAMEAEIAATLDHYGDASSLWGIAVHHYAAWAVLPD